MFKAIANLFNTMSLTGRYQRALEVATTVPEVRALLQKADKGNHAYDIVAAVTLKNARGGMFANQMEKLQKVAQARVLYLAIDEAGLGVTYAYSVDVANGLTDKISMIDADLMSNNPGISFLASEAIQEGKDLLDGYAAHTKGLPALKAIAPELYGLTHGVSQARIDSDREWDIFDFANYESRTKIKDRFVAIRDNISAGVNRIENHALQQAVQRYTGEMKYIYGNVVEAPTLAARP